jgi:hypothetical protein
MIMVIVRLGGRQRRMKSFKKEKRSDREVHGKRGHKALLRKNLRL